MILNPINDQSVFDTVSLHLLAQKKRCISREGMCQYQLGRLSCAIGCLIPKNDYLPAFEGEIIEKKTTNIGQYLRRRGFNLQLLTDLQYVHDDYTPGQWRDELKTLARKYKLSPDVLRLKKG